jgi:hypothetical protein
MDAVHFLENPLDALTELDRILTRRGTRPRG